MQDTTHFGFKDVATSEKTGLVRDVFDKVAGNYDLMNDVLSFGVHRLWKHYAAAATNIKNGDLVLDLAAGSGDMAIKFSKKVGADGRVILADINQNMLEEGRKNLLDNGVFEADFVVADAENLPFSDNSFDLVSIAFGLRNITDKELALREMLRVLKVGGRLLILEFSKTEHQLLRKFYDFYSFNIMPKIGGIIADDEPSYQYLAESIRRHPDAQTLKNMVLDAGFGFCEYQTLSGGITALHKAVKLDD